MNAPPRFKAPVHCWLVPAVVSIFVVLGCTSAPPIETRKPAPLAIVTSPAPATSLEVEHVQKFTDWVSEFKGSARAAGIDDPTLHIAFDSVRFIPRVIEMDRAQPEFTRAVWDYLDSTVSTQRIRRGQEKLQLLRPGVDVVAARYGVPAEIIFAIWGMESNFGSFVGDIPTIDALATLGFEGRREEWARDQLLAALKILQSGDIDRAQMLGSWAGAMGQTQFLPSNYLAYAVDSDSDGRRDLWGSVADVVASTANFLVRSGWKVGQPSVVEVRLPPGFDYARADDDVRQPSYAWAVEGVHSVSGVPLPTLPDSSILLPSSANGPAFLVGPNFRTILRYNNSTSYALAVSLLAQRLAGGPAMQTPWPRDIVTLTRSQLLALQTALNGLGFDCGTPDGMMGPATRRGIRRYQHSQGMPADGYPSLGLLHRLQ